MDKSIIVRKTEEPASEELFEKQFVVKTVAKCVNRPLALPESVVLSIKERLASEKTSGVVGEEVDLEHLGDDLASVVDVSKAFKSIRLKTSAGSRSRVWAGAERKKSSNHINFESISDELNKLVTLDITAPEHEMGVGSLMTRMLFLGFVTYAAKKDKDNDIINATNRTTDFYNKNPNNKTKNTYLWGVRMYSELHNCLTFIESRVEASNYLLDLLQKSNNRDEISKSEHFDFITGTICYMKAYNLLMDAVAKKFKTPELVFAKISLNKIIRACESYSSVDESSFDVSYLDEYAPSRAKSEILSAINLGAATLFSAMVSGFNVLVDGCEEEIC